MTDAELLDDIVERLRDVESMLVRICFVDKHEKTLLKYEADKIREKIENLDVL